MGRAEMLILLGAIMIYGIFSVSVNDARFKNEYRIIQSQFEILAVAIANSYLEEGKSKEFDEVFTGTPPTTLPDNFTDPASMGTDTGETYPNFDDLDDFNSYSLTDTSSIGFVYTVSISVTYVTTSDFSTASASRTFYKRMDVTVSSPDLTSNIVMSRIYPFIG